MTLRKPNFIIIGSAKCGTTTLAGILESHPDCCFSNPKEVWFFQEKALNAIDASERNPNYAKGWEWYSKAWAHYKGEPLVGEATPAYTDRTNCPLVASRIYEFNPETKIIYMVREPMARQVSFWQMMVRRSYEYPGEDKEISRIARAGFESFMTMARNTKAIWDETRYHYQLEPYLKLFPRDHVLVTFLEDWNRDQPDETRRILEFLELDPSKIDLTKNLALHQAKDAQVHTALQRMVVKSGLRPMLKQVIGPEIWDGLSGRYAMTPMNDLAPKLSPQLIHDFLDYVWKDNQMLLGEWGKAAGFWNPERIITRVMGAEKGDAVNLLKDLAFSRAA